MCVRSIFASVEESVQGDAQGSADIHLRGLDIKNIEPGLLGLGRSDPFFEIRKKSADHASGVVRWSPVYRSEHIFNHLNPYWKPFSIGLEEVRMIRGWQMRLRPFGTDCDERSFSCFALQLCHCDLDWPIRVTVMDWERNGKHRPIGQIETTPRGLQERLAVRGNADRVNAFDIVHDDQITSMGLICVLKVELHLQE